MRGRDGEAGDGVAAAAAASLGWASRGGATLGRAGGVGATWGRASSRAGSGGAALGRASSSGEALGWAVSSGGGHSGRTPSCAALAAAGLLALRGEPQVAQDRLPHAAGTTVGRNGGGRGAVEGGAGAGERAGDLTVGGVGAGLLPVEGAREGRRVGPRNGGRGTL